MIKEGLFTGLHFSFSDIYRPTVEFESLNSFSCFQQDDNSNEQYPLGTANKASSSFVLYPMPEIEI